MLGIVTVVQWVFGIRYFWYCVLCTRYYVCRVLGIRSIVYWVLGD